MVFEMQDVYFYFELERGVKEIRRVFRVCTCKKGTYTPKWVECSDRRELESLNVHWMAIKWHYSAQYMLECFLF